ncbi:MAG: ACP S-malonyltransferase, partial [Candidatus Omnitrophota bacterium]
MVEKIAYIFPGQGAQYVGMGRDLYEKLPVSREVFDKADKILGFSVSRLCFEGPQDALGETRNCQLAILVTSIAALEAFNTEPRTRNSELKYAAGLSLGEYSALVAAGAISFEEALILVRKRSELMSEASERFPGKMLAVLGLDLETVKNLSKQTDIEIANLNCPGQVVVTGKSQNIDSFSALAKTEGAARLVELEVSGAFHSKLMSEASVKFKQELERANFAIPKINVISNVTARPFASIEVLRTNLALQVKSSVLWEDSVRFMAAAGVKKFFEIGPG